MLVGAKIRDICDHHAVTDGPHDVLAAEEFVLPAPDPDLRGPVKLPEDPTGIAEPHDVLAAEEFPMPAARRPLLGQAGPSKQSRGLVGAGGLLALALLRRRRR
jgi:hypothetical protein